MDSSKIFPATMALAMLCLMAGSATPAQGGQRRVLTNDDVASPAPAPETPAGSGTSAAPTAPAASPATSNAPADASVASPSAPQSQLGQLTNIVEALGQAFDVLANKINAGSADDATLARWTTMRDSLVNLLVEFRSFADQARAAAPQQPKMPQQKSDGTQEATGSPAGAP